MASRTQPFSAAPSVHAIYRWMLMARVAWQSIDGEENARRKKTLFYFYHVAFCRRACAHKDGVRAYLMIVVAKSRVGSVIWTIPLWMQSLVGMKAKHSFQSWSRRSHLNLMPTRYLVTLT